MSKARMVATDEHGFRARIIADSMSADGARMTTMELRFPRYILAEVNTHRTFSRNSASSRAIPTEKMLARLEQDPFVPFYWGKNQPGMAAGEELVGEDRATAIRIWEAAARSAGDYARELSSLGVHKQVVNRLIEPFMWHVALVSGTEWSNFFAQRCHLSAAPEIQAIAMLMRDCYQLSNPQLLGFNQWHQPFIEQEDREEIARRYRGAAASPTDVANWVSIARCARTSYLTHDGRRDITEDIRLYEKLSTARPPHLSPFEHVARPTFLPRERNGNLIGWRSARMSVEFEHDATYLSD